MLNSEMLKDAALGLGADLCGIASMDRFEGAPKQQDPRYIFPDAKACISLAFRIPRGYLRGIEEGTYFVAYTAMGYSGMNKVYMPTVQRGICCFLEDHGYEAAPITNAIGASSVPYSTQTHDSTISRPVREGYPNPDILVDERIAAYAAGLGEIGYSKVFLTPEFGPFQRFATILTDAPLEPDPIFEGGLCDKCKQCVKQCTGCAISGDETESIVVAGRKIEWGKLDYMKCSVAYKGGNPSFNPFMRDTYDPEKYKDKYCGYPDLEKDSGYPQVLGNNPALEGARGCMRACYVHLEERGVLKKKFVNRFRKRPQWELPPSHMLGHSSTQAHQENHGVE